LLRGEEPVPLTPNALETLLILVRNSERVVLKDDLMKSLWPDSFVEEANLSQNIFLCERRWERRPRMHATSPRFPAEVTGLPKKCSRSRLERRN
jgi:hypothetical protein